MARAAARTGTCTPTGEFALEIRLPDGSGSVLAECHYTWNGTGVWPDCNGPVNFLRTRNTGDQTAWAMLPDKKKQPLWIQLDPGTDVTVTAAGQLNNLGLSNASDVRSVTLSFVNPA
jgi:hypothetical protein